MASVRQKNGTWYLRFWCPEQNKSRERSIGPISKKDANAAARAATIQENQMKKGREVREIVIDLASASDGITFNQFLSGWAGNKGWIEDYVVRHTSNESDIRSRFRDEGPIRDWFGDLVIAHSKSVRAQWRSKWTKYATERLKTVRPRTVKHEHEYIRLSLNWAVDAYGLVEISPFYGVAHGLTLKKSEKGYFKPDCLDRLTAQQTGLQAAETRFIAHTGMRRGEACILKKASVGRDEIKVISPKTSSDGVAVRYLGLSEGAQEARERILAETEGGALFFTPRHKDTWTSRFQRARDRARKKLEEENKVASEKKEVSDALQDGTLNWLRHTYISALVNDAKVPLPIVAELAGHTKVETTMKYIHVTDQHKKDAIKAMDALGY